MNFKIFKYRYFNLFVLAFFILNFWSCVSPNEPGNPKSNYSVLFNLTANADSQKIYIYRIADNNGYVYNNNLGEYSVKTANISLSNSIFNYSNFIIKDVQQRNNPFSKGAYYTNSDSLKIFSSTQYYLNININGSGIKGMVTTPDDFNILSPLPNSTINANDSINITWTSSYTIKGYIIIITQTGVPLYNDDFDTFYGKDSFITQDTSFVSSSNFISEGSIKIDILAYDENYYNHFINNVPNSGIDGAYGYFAASVLKSVTVSVSVK